MTELPDSTAEKLAAKLDELARRRRELEGAMADPEVIADTARYTGLTKQYGALGRFSELDSELKAALAQQAEARELLAETEVEPEMEALARDELESASKARQRVLDEFLDLMATDTQNAGRNVIMEVRSGTGGEEAALFAADLLRMYQHYCQKRSWKVELLDSSPSDMGGLREVTVLIKGRGAWEKLRYESGGHRVQRVPVTESQGRIHTSLATVAVLPEAEEVDVKLNPEDVEMSFMRSSGPGGQNVNKVSTCVRLLHKPTGITVKCQQEKSQHKNRKLAEKMLRARLYEIQQEDEKQRRDELRRTQVGSGDRNERIRTYNFPQDRITDHRIGLDVFGIEAVLMGGCDPIFDALAEHDRQARIHAMIEQ